MIAAGLLVVALVTGVASVLLAITHPGYVLLSYGHWSIETSLVVLVLGVALWCLLLYALARLAVGLLHLPSDVRQALRRRRESRGLASFEAGLLALLEGRWSRAEVELLRHAADRRAPYLNYLAAARAAQRLDAPDRRDHYLALARESADSDRLRVALLITQAELQRERGEYELVKNTVLELRKLERQNSYAIDLQAEALEALRDWQALDRLLRDDDAASMNPSLRRRLQHRAGMALLRDAAGGGSLEKLKSQWNDVAGFEKTNDLRRVYAQGLLFMGASSEALAQVTEVLDHDWDAGFAQLCSQFPAKDALPLLANIERWLQAHGERPELLAAAGKTCLDNRLWGKAQSYLETVIRVAPTPQAYWNLARLAEQTQRPDEASRCWREGLELAIQMRATSDLAHEPE